MENAEGPETGTIPTTTDPLYVHLTYVYVQRIRCSRNSPYKHQLYISLEDGL
jgi:hypothetical protein